MGMIHISTSGSFALKDRHFSAIEHGHAHAVAEAIEFLVSTVLPEAIAQDHQLHERGDKPQLGFAKPF